MLKKSTIQLLRFHFSIFLMPVFWYALSQTPNIDLQNAWLIFFILHVLIYPASNGYNSYMDRDTESVGGIKSPLPPTRELFYVTIVMDLIAILCSFTISLYFTIGIACYILASRAYSYRGIRLKKYPFIGYGTVIIFQGAVTFFLVVHGASTAKTLDISLTGMLASSFLVGSFYPLSQIYQHRQDLADKVITISYKLGYNGTFIFCGIVYALAVSMLWINLTQENSGRAFWIIQLWLLPVTAYFLWWFYQVYQDKAAANFSNTMRMNLIASAGTNAAFIYLFINNKL